MKPIVDFAECLKDSPKFRIALEEVEDDIDQLEAKLEKLVKLCTATVESGKVYINSKAQFINGIKELVFYFRDDTFNVNALNKLIQALQEMDKYQSILIDQARRTVCKNLGGFINSDIRKVKDTKRCFEKYSDEYDQALIRSSQAPRTKQHECEEANNAVTAARSGFQHTSLDYICQVSMLQSKKRYEVLDTLLSYLHAHSTFFHQGSDLCQDVDPFMKQLATSLTRIRGESGQLERSMDDRHALANEKEKAIQLSHNGVRLEGYLFKRTSNAFKSWKRRWFVIRNQQLVYCKRSKDMTVTVMEEDLRLCTVKPVAEVDRRFCFEVLSPSKSHVLQADNEEMYNTWFSSLQAGIGAALQLSVQCQKEGNSKSSKEDLRTEVQRKDGPPSLEVSLRNEPKPKSPWEEIVSTAGNDMCCDCSSAQPQWASINLGITLCIDCSGCHRSLGVHHSKVRSLRLDDWDPELIKLMKSLGNGFINGIYEAAVDESIATRPTAGSPSHVRTAWIKAKYVKRAFVEKPVNRAKIHLLRTPNIRQPRRPSLQAVKSPTTAAASALALADNRTDLPSSEIGGTDSLPKDDSVNIPGGVIREKKHSIVSSNEFHSRRTAVIFEDQSASDRAAHASPSMDKNAHLDDADIAVTLSSRRLVRLDAGADSVPATAIEDSRLALVTGDSDEYSDDEDEDVDPNLQLYRASSAADLHEMCKALALGANVCWVNVDDDQRCPIHEAIASGSVMACEYLFLNGAKIDAKDSMQRTPLHIASDLGFTGHVCLLLKRGADQKAKDTYQKDALSYAVDNANADIVTLLRLAKLNEEMKETEFGNSDETFNEVVRDFSQRASSAPESRKRQSLGSSGSG